MLPGDRFPYTAFDKKGNPVTNYKHLVQYVDVRNGKIYTVNEYGKLVGEDGTIIEMNGDVVNNIKSYDE